MTAVRTPSSRLVNAFLAGSLVALAASGAYWGVARAAAKTAPPPAADLFSLVPVYAPRPCPSRIADAAAADACRVEFDVPAGDRVLGVLTARAFPEKTGGPDFSRPIELATSQIGGRLDLEEWFAKEPPSGAHWLQFCLRATRGNEEFAWSGWTRFEATDLAQGRLVVAPARGASARICVRTRGGQAVPGALVGLDPTEMPTGCVTDLLSTGGDGAVRVEGLDAGVEFTARLPEGVGPSRERVETKFAPAAGGADVALEAPLAGRWTFVEETVLLPLEGAAIDVTEVRSPDSTLAVAWPVARWVGPGRGPRTPLHVMHPEGRKPATRASLCVKQTGPLDIPDLSRPFEVAVAFAPGRLVATLHQPEAAAGGR